jgi:phospholipid-translocating ATPase
MLDGAYQSAVCYFFSYCVFFTGGFVTTNGLQVNDRELYGVFTATSAIIACNLYVMMNQYRWDWLFLLIVVISIGLVFFWTGIYTQFLSSTVFYHAAQEVYSTLPFWANTGLALVTCLLPRFTAKAYQAMFLPMDVDIIREQVSQHKFDYLNQPTGVPPDAMSHTLGSDDSEEKHHMSGSPASTGHTEQTWRKSLERISGEHMHMSVDIPELARAKTLIASVDP